MKEHISPFARYEQREVAQTEIAARVRQFAMDFPVCECRARMAGLSLRQFNALEYSIMGWNEDGSRKWVKRIHPGRRWISQDPKYGKGPHIAVGKDNFTLPEIVGAIIAKIEDRDKTKGLQS